MCTEKPIEELILNTKELDFAKSYHEKQMMIVDAVNVSKCKPIAGCCMQGKTHVSMVTSENKLFKKGEIHFTSPMSGNRCWRMICTIEEYNQCIEEMKYHYDIPKWCSYNRTDKELLTVENSDQSFYEKEKFVYGQDVYVNYGERKNRLMKFGCFTLDSKKALLFDVNDNGYCRVTVESISSQPFKSKEDIELEESKKKQVDNLVRAHSCYIASNNLKKPMVFMGLIERMQENGDLAEIILPLEES